MMMWDKLLSDYRCPREGGTPRPDGSHSTFRSAFEVDYDRVIFSNPFRRLSRKTQVHPMALNDHIHTRLTHSLEVASVGRSLARRLARFLVDRNELPVGVTEWDLSWILQAACLAHDIGNPPFGHAGEYAIREWVKTHPEEVFGNATIAAELRKDFEIFEGNAQGFRIAARADNMQAAYIRLTYASLGAMIKYPWGPTDLRVDPVDENKGKFNIFSSERQLFADMVDRMGMRDDSGKVARHPLSFLSEAADDICYRILDLEDAVEMRILKEDRVSEIFKRIAPPPPPPADAPVRPASPTSLSQLRAAAIGTLTDAMWNVFVADYDNIMNGLRLTDLKAGLPADLDTEIKNIKSIYTEIFADRTKVAAELGAYKTLGRIIKALCQAIQKLNAAGSYKDSGFLAKRCMDLAWGEAYVTANQKQPYDWWLHQVMDYVSGLTDNYSRQLSREIEGT